MKGEINTDNQNKPTARKKRIVGAGTGVEKKGEGLGTGPVNNAGNYADRREQQNAQKPVQQHTPQAQNQSSHVAGKQQTFSGTQQASGQPYQRPAQSPFGQQQPAVNPFGQSQQRPSQQNHGQNHQQPSHQNTYGQNSQRPVQNSVPQNSTRTGSGTPGQRTGSTGSAGGKGILLIIAIIAIIFFGKNLLGGDGNNITNLLSSFLNSGESSAYDFTGILSSLSGSNSSSSTQEYFTSTLENNTSEPDLTVAASARDKFTVIKGNKKDTVTILVYMCGTDLESQNGMGTSDLKEMLNAKISDNVNLIVFTGGCKKWRNNVVSNSVNQIYQIKDGSLTRLSDDFGSSSMTNPSTLADFIRYGKENFPANRMCLIFWDHGGGSISGFGYDERYGKNQSMTLAGINKALKDGGVQFDFIGFDACLMATVENGLMLSQYADYMIASEETEPGVGWYYTNWLTKLSSNPSMSTVDIGKIITDDFVDVCNQQCRGQATTLSVIDLAELAATVPGELKSFSVETNQLIQNQDYKKVSSARSKTREFAQQTGIDQIDLVHFAKNLGTNEGQELADALLGAVKYNRTGGGISNAYGLSIYFPYKKTSKVSQIVSTYKEIGMDDEYTRCIQEFASLEVSGQLSSGTSIQNYGSYSVAPQGLMDSLLGGSDYYGSISGNYGSNDLESLLGGYFSGTSSGNTGSILDLFIGRSITAESAATYISKNHFDPSALVWKNGRITLEDDQWAFLDSIMKNVFYDDGTGYIDLGFDPQYETDGNDLVYEFDGTWLSIDRHPVAYYRTGLIEQDDCYVEIGYVPAYVNGVRANLILVFDMDNPYGYIAGAQQIYLNNETEAVAKTMIRIGKGDRIQLVCDFYDYDGNYKDSYYLGDSFILGDEVEIGNTYIDAERCRVTYCLTDFYQQHYWTPAVI